MKLWLMNCFLNISHFACQIANQVITNLLMIRSNRNVQVKLVSLYPYRERWIKQQLSIQHLGNAKNAQMTKFVKHVVTMMWILALHVMMILVQIYLELAILVQQTQSFVNMEIVQILAVLVWMDSACIFPNAFDALIKIVQNVKIQKIACFVQLNIKLQIYRCQINQASMVCNCNNKLNYLDKYYPDCASCEIDPSNLTNITCKACVNGYIFNGTGDCLSKCPTGYYGVSVYSRRAMLEQSYCERCNSSCEECFDSQYCKSCPIGQYLDRLSYDKSYGNCKVKLQSNYTGILYVTNNNISLDVQTLNGSQQKPFGDLEDGIIRANELASKYLFADITIYLQNTSDFGLNHYLLRTSRDFYQPLFYERDSQNLKLIIKPDPSTVDEGEKITIFNKRRDKFQLRVGRGLTIENIIIDSLDSILPIDKDGNGCLKRKEKCCEMGSDGVISNMHNVGLQMDQALSILIQTIRHYYMSHNSQQQIFKDFDQKFQV
eukprot:403333207